MEPAPEHVRPADGRNALRRAVIWVAALNLAYFLVEFTVARRIGSVSLFADSIDFLEDAAVNGLVLLALGWPLQRRGTVGVFLALILLVPGIATDLDRLAEVPVTDSAFPAAALPDGDRRIGRQSFLRLYLDPGTPCRRQPVPRGFSLRSQ